MRRTTPSSRIRSVAKLPLVFALSVSVLMLGSIIGALAQQGLQIQVNPTETPDGPGGFQIEATNTPTPRVTEEPDPPDSLQANPTDTPTPRITEEATVDDIQANPTAAPSIDDVQANPVTGTVRVIKRDCPPGVFQGSLLGGELTDYLPICTQPHDGVEFVLNDANGAELGLTANGVVEWTGVDTGPFAIVETIPGGYANPIVFCGFTESPGGGVQHPSLQPAPGGTVSGTFPNEAFEYVCYWMNIKVDTSIPPGPGSVANPEGGSFGDLRVTKRACPFVIAPGQLFAYYLETCTEVVDGIPFTLINQQGESTKDIANGEAIWDSVPEGPFTIQETIPAQYGEPIVFCGWNALYEGVAYDAFTHQLPSNGGLVEGEILIPNTHYQCFYFNTQSGPGSFADAESRTSNLLVRKWTCPEGTLPNQERYYYWRVCELMVTPVEFTLTNANGDATESTSAGIAHWNDIPLGEFTLTESIPDGYGKPVVFCGWWAEYDGFIYDAFPQLVILAGLVVEGAITVPNTEYMCDWFNIEGGIDDLQANPTEAPGIDDLQANPTAVPGIDDEAIPTTGTVRIIKRDCPLGIVEDATLSDYLELCPQHHDGVEFTLNEADGTQVGATAGGQVQWTGVNPGAFDVQETVPAGYTDPIVFCGFTESPGGGVQHPALQTATGGMVSGTFPDSIFEYVCYWMNIKDTGQVGTGPGSVANPQGEGGTSTLLVRKKVCPFGTALDLDGAAYAEQCTGELDGVQVTVTHANGSTTKPITGGQAQWEGLPLGTFSIQEAIPGGFGDPIISCLVIAYPEDGNWVFGTFVNFTPAPDGLVNLDVAAAFDLPDLVSTHITCTIYNMALQPGSYAAPENTTNTLVARKWLCPAGIDRTLHLLDLFEQCSRSDAPVGFTLTNADGTFPQDTAAGMAQWDDVPLGPFTLEETVPNGYEEPFVWCGWTAFYNGAVYDAFHMLMPSPGGVVSNEISVPNTHYLCHFFNAEVEIDDFQANPTEVPGIDDVTSNPVEPGTLTVHKWDCPSGYDPLAGSALDDCTESLNGIVFDLVNHAVGEPDFQSTTGEIIDGAAIFEPVPGTYSLMEQIPNGYGTPFLWNCSGLDNPALPEPPISTINFFRIVIESNQVIECDWMNVPDSEFPFFRANAKACPADFDINVNWMEVFQNCTIPIEGVEFTFTDASGSSTQPLTGTFVQWNQVGIGEGQTVELVEDIPSGYTEPVVLCSSWPMEAGDPFDWYYEPVMATGGVISVTPNLEGGQGPLGVIPEGEGFDCKFFHYLEAEIDDVQANPPAAQAEVRIVEYVCEPGWDPYTEASWGWFLFLNACTQTLGGWQELTFDYELTNDAGFLETVTNPLDTGANPITVPIGAVTISSTVPGGFGDPVTMCVGSGYTPLLSPPPPAEQQWDIGPSVTVDLAEGDSRLCQFFHMVSEPLTNSVVVNAWACPAGTTGAEALPDLLAACAEGQNGLEFTSLTWNDAGIQVESTVDGVVVFEESALGSVWISPDLPQDAETLAVYCGIAGTLGGEVEEYALHELTMSGQAVGYLEVPGTTFACHWFATSVEIDDFQVNPTEAPDGPGGFQANPTETPGIDDLQVNPTEAPGIDSVAVEVDLTNSVTARKWLCPGDTYPSEDQDYLESACTLSSTPVEFTLTNDDGASSGATSGGWTTWDDVPLGTFTVEESLLDGYGEPIAFCNWTAFYEGNVYDSFSQFVPSPGGVVEGEITVPNTSYACDFFNIGTSHWISVRARACPEGLNPTDSYWFGNNEDECGGNILTGVPVGLITDGGTLEGVTDESGSMQWDFVDLGDGTIQIQQDIPEGFGEPTVWCVSFPVAAGDAQDFEYFLVPATNGMVSVQPEQHFPYRFSCIFYNIPATEHVHSLSLQRLQL